MGLDMYLSKRNHVKNWEFEKDTKFAVTTRNNGKVIPHIKKNRVTTVIEEVGYWRKENHIHRWFVENCQDGEDDCREAWVSSKKLLVLSALCLETKKYLDTCKKNLQPNDYYTFDVDQDTIEDLLPTKQGFFFGGTSYDRWYYESLDDTIKIIKDALKGVDDTTPNVSYYYSSSW